MQSVNCHISTHNDFNTHLLEQQNSLVEELHFLLYFNAIASMSFINFLFFFLTIQFLTKKHSALHSVFFACQYTVSSNEHILQMEFCVTQSSPGIWTKFTSQLRTCQKKVIEANVIPRTPADGFKTDRNEIHRVLAQVVFIINILSSIK